MPRPAIHDPDVLLDAAAALYVDGGERAVTMTAVARASGAPSGSLYHRFPDRSALLAALWLRTLSRFHAGLYEILDRDQPAATAAVDCARHVVTWCTRHRTDARVLLAGRGAVAPDPWPEAAGRELRAVEGRLTRAVRALVDAVVAETGTDARVARLAVIDLPYAAVRPHLTRGRPVPGHVEGTVAAAVRTLLT